METIIICIIIYIIYKLLNKGCSMDMNTLRFIKNTYSQYLEQDYLQDIILAMIYVESRGKPKAYRPEPSYYVKYVKQEYKDILKHYGIDKNNYGSRGLMQVLDDNFIVWYDNIYNAYPLSIENFYDTKQNITIGRRILQQYIQIAKDKGYTGYEAIRQGIRYYNGGSNATSKKTLDYSDCILYISGKIKEV